MARHHSSEMFLEHSKSIAETLVVIERLQSDSELALIGARMRGWASDTM